MTKQAVSRRRSWQATVYEIVEYTTTGSGSGFLFLGDKTASLFFFFPSMSSFLGPSPSLFHQISSSSSSSPLSLSPSLSVCLTLQICEAMHSEWISRAEASDSPLWNRQTGRQAGRQAGRVQRCGARERVNESEGVRDGWWDTGAKRVGWKDRQVGKKMQDAEGEDERGRRGAHLKKKKAKEERGRGGCDKQRGREERKREWWDEEDEDSERNSGEAWENVRWAQGGERRRRGVKKKKRRRRRRRWEGGHQRSVFCLHFVSPPFLKYSEEKQHTRRGRASETASKNTTQWGTGSTCLAEHLTVCEAHKCRTSPWRRRRRGFFCCPLPPPHHTHTHTTSFARRPCSTLDSSDTQPGCESVHSSVCLRFQNIRSKLMTTIIAAYWEWCRLVVIALPPLLLVIIIKMSGGGWRRWRVQLLIPMVMMAIMRSNWELRRRRRGADASSRAGESSAQDAAVQRNHRVEGFLCAPLRSQSADTCAPARGCCAAKLTTITVRRQKSNPTVLLTHRGGFDRPLHYATLYWTKARPALAAPTPSYLLKMHCWKEISSIWCALKLFFVCFFCFFLLR